MKRRTLLQLGLGTAVVIGVAGAGVALLRPGLIGARLSPASRSLMRAVARAVLDGSLPAPGPALEAALDLQLDQLDASIAGFPPSVRDELSQMLALLTSAPGRWSLAGLRSDWSTASLDELGAALQDMRCSSLALRQQIYHALRDLNCAVFFAEPAHWAQIGYPGPKDIA